MDALLSLLIICLVVLVSVVRAVLVHSVRTNHETLYTDLGEPAPISRMSWGFVYQLRATSSYTQLSAYERRLINAAILLDVLLLSGFLTAVVLKI